MWHWSVLQMRRELLRGSRQHDDQRTLQESELR